MTKTCHPKPPIVQSVDQAARCLCAGKSRIYVCAILRTVALGCLLLIAPSQASGDPIGIVDQEQTIDNGSNAMAGPRWQTFVPSLSGLDVVEVKIGGNGLTDSVEEVLQINIHDGDPTGAILGSSDQVTLEDAFSTGIVHFDFPSVVSLTPGNSYAIQLLPVANVDSSFKTVRISGGVGVDSYASGAYYTEPTEPSSPGNIDMWFRTGLHVPEPASLILFTLGLIGLVAQRRPRR